MSYIKWTEQNAKRLRMKRAKEKLTQVELSEKIGVSSVAVAAYERGEKERVNSKTFMRMMNYLTSEVDSA